MQNKALQIWIINVNVNGPILKYYVSDSFADLDN